MNKGRILIVDDEKLVRWSLVEDLGKEGYQADAAADGAEAIAKCEAELYDIVLLDIRLPDSNGIEVLQKLKRLDPHVIVMMMTAYGDVETAVEAMKAGAHDYIGKPFNLAEIRTRVERAFENIRLKEEVVYLRKFQRERLNAHGIICRSKAMRELVDMMQKVSKSDSTLILLGESGTGKDLAARYIHFRSLRAEHAFVDINCAALPETLLESELMGHEKGAFTDAKNAKRGLFEEAAGGTVFLDEVGDMPLSIQAKVLKLIDTKRFRRLGGTKDLEADVRIIAATNKDLEALMKEGKLREDFYYRLKVMSLFLPPLRERKSDVPLLANHFLRQFSRNPSEKRRTQFSQEAMDHLLNYHWPGNVRELKNVIERAVIIKEGETILPKHLPPEILADKGMTRGFELSDIEIPPEGLPLAEVEREVIKRVLAMAEGNLCKAARMLHITRDTLRYRLKKMGIALT